MGSRIFEFIKFLVGWPISAISLIFLLKLLPNSLGVISNLRTINLPVILLSIFFFELYFLLRGFLWQLILRYKGYDLEYKKTLFLWGFSELKRYTPGNIWSFLGRLVSFNKLGIKNKDIVHSLFIEGELIIAGSILVSLLSVNFLFTILPLPSFKYQVLTQPLIFIFVIALGVFFAFNRRFIKKSPFPPFKPLQISILLLVSFLSLLSFGIGTYFAGSSIFFLDPHRFLSFAGFYVLALLIGYLTVITPTGLGVREGVITLVLSKILLLSTAVFIAIFARVIFVLSEVLFLFLSWILYEIKNKFVFKLINLINRHKQESLLLLFVISYFIYFTSASFLRYDSFFTGRFDLGNMDQTIWNTIHGRIFQITNPNGTDIISRLAFHADFLLILISPLYWIWNNPKMLLLLQSAVVSTGAVFVYLISKDTIKNIRNLPLREIKNFSLILSLSFLLNPALEHSNLYDFHPVVLATISLLAAFYFMKVKRYLLMIVFLFLSGISKENIWVIVSLFGLYLTFFERKKILGILIFFISLTFFYFLVWTVIPKAAGTQHFALSYYSDFGDSPTRIIQNIITSPLKTFSGIFHKDQLLYLQQLFYPLGFLPLLSPLYFLFALPSLIVDLLSSNSQLHRIYYQYSASITPFLFISAIYSVKFLKSRTKNISLNFYAIFILLSTLISAYSFGPILGAKNPNISMFTEDLTNNNLIDRFLQRIPKRYAIAATNDVGSHVSHRQNIYTLPLGLNKADVIVLYSSVSFDVPSQRSNKMIIDKLLADKNYFLVYRDYEFVVFKKKGLKKSFYYF